MKNFVLGTGLIMALFGQAAPASAATWDVNFSFTGETVIGTIVTTCDNCFLQQANVSSWSLTFSGAVTGSASSGPLNQSPPAIFSNVLDATGGKLLYVLDPLGGNGALFTDFASSAQLEFGFNVSQDQIHVQDATTLHSITGTVTLPFQLATEEVVSTVPLPGALPLFATGLGALGLLGWRRKRKPQVA
jgi:opacity protein-like surface antigen